MPYKLRPRQRVNYVETNTDSDDLSEPDLENQSSDSSSDSKPYVLNPEDKVPDHINGRASLEKGAQLYAKKRKGMCLGFVGRSPNNLYWKCKAGHKWQATFAVMQEHHTWCPSCPFIRERTCRNILEDLLGKEFPPCTPAFLNGLRLDGYCEELKLAFEHNGQQHYDLVPHFHRQGLDDLKQQKKRDNKKKSICSREKVALITIPYYVSELSSYIKDELIYLGYLME